MRVRTFGLSILALGILIGAGGCSSESPTSPLAPGTVSADKGGVPNAAAPGFPQDTTVTTQGGAYAGSGGRTVTATGGAYAGSGG